MKLMVSATLFSAYTCAAFSAKTPDSCPTKQRYHHSLLPRRAGGAGDVQNVPGASGTVQSNRRSWLAKGLVSASSAILLDLGSDPPSAVADVYALPTKMKQFTVLAPLGTPKSTGSKLTGLSLSEIASRLSHDLVEGSTGKGGYFISGKCDISTEIFRDDCIFVDPTNAVPSLSRYENALKILFDPDRSYVQLLGKLEIDETKNQITARIRSGGVLKLPWSPRISSYERLPNQWPSRLHQTIRLGKKSFVECTCFLPDGTGLVTGSSDGFVEIWGEIRSPTIPVVGGCDDDANDRSLPSRAFAASAMSAGADEIDFETLRTSDLSAK